MPILLLLLFIGVPVAEIALFIEIGGEIGLGWTLLCIVATALAGTALVRYQGLQTLARARTAMAENRMPIGEVIAGMCILVAGALLLTPGFLTDALGFVLLIPPLRNAMAAGAIRRMKASGRFTAHGAGFAQGHPGGPHPGVHASAGRGPAGRGGAGKGPIIDGDFEEVRPPEGPGDDTSPWHKDGDAPALPSETKDTDRSDGGSKP